MYITNKKALKLINEVIAEHSANILADLGMTEDNDGILDRIYACTVNEEQAATRGWFGYTVVQIRKTFSIGIQSQHYQKDSGHIDIYAHGLRHTHILGVKGKVTAIPNLRLLLSKKNFKEIVLFCLAHEMRHYWQIYTGRIWKHRSSITGQSYMPYEYRWEEQDANNYARSYISRISSK